MHSLVEIQEAVARLSRSEFAELSRWFEDYRNRQWDRQIEADSASGALDFLLQEGEKDIAKGRTRQTDESSSAGNN